MATIMQQPDINTPLFYRYKPESANMILYWDRSIITDKMVASNRPDIVLTDRINHHLQ
jgi:hypothetical protein